MRHTVPVDPGSDSGPGHPGPRPLHTRSELAADLTAIGVRPGDTLLVHSSLKAIGWIPGGSLAVVQALLDAVGPSGTLVVPTQSSDNSDPAGWSRPPVPPEWWPLIRAETPGFDPLRSASPRMGQIAEQVRTWPGARRSAHPQTSFAALGRHAEEIVAIHDIDSQCGERSPLAALERLGARVLLLGAGFGSCTSFHLAEYRIDGSPVATHGAAVLAPDGGREWLTFTDLELDESDFADIGTHFVATGAVTVGTVGEASTFLFDLAAGVEAARAWMSEHRRPSAPAAGS